MEDVSIDQLLDTVNACRIFRKLALWKIIKNDELYAVEIINPKQENWHTNFCSKNEIYYYLKGALRMHNDLRLNEIFLENEPK